MLKITHSSGKTIVFKDLKAVSELLETGLKQAEINKENQGVFIGAFTFKVDKITNKYIYMHNISM